MTNELIRSGQVVDFSKTPCVDRRCYRNVHVRYFSLWCGKAWDEAILHNSASYMSRKCVCLASLTIKYRGWQKEWECILRDNSGDVLGYVRQALFSFPIVEGQVSKSFLIRRYLRSIAGPIVAFSPDFRPTVDIY